MIGAAIRWASWTGGAVAQLGERRLCKAEVGGSSPPGSTRSLLAASGDAGRMLFNPAFPGRAGRYPVLVITPDTPHGRMSER